MIYYVYFDGYGHPKKAITKEELTEQYQDDPHEFLKAMGNPERQGPQHATGHVGILRFNTHAELEEFLNSLGDEITGFYGCLSDSRPYNF